MKAEEISCSSAADQQDLRTRRRTSRPSERMGAFCSSCQTRGFSSDSESMSRWRPSTAGDATPMTQTPGRSLPLSSATSRTRLTAESTTSQTPFFIRSCARRVTAILSSINQNTGSSPRAGHAINSQFNVQDVDVDEELEEEEDETLTWDPRDIIHIHNNRTSANNQTASQSYSHTQIMPITSPVSHHVIEFPLLESVIPANPQPQATENNSRRFSWFFSPRKVHDSTSLSADQEESGVHKKVIVDQQAIMHSDMEWDDFGLEKV